MSHNGDPAVRRPVDRAASARGSRAAGAARRVPCGRAALPLAGCCSGDDTRGRPSPRRTSPPAPRGERADGGTLRWAVDAMPGTLNAFQADADATTTRIAGAVLPAHVPPRRPRAAAAQRRLPGRPRSSRREPKQVVALQAQPARRCGATAARSAPPTSPPSGRALRGKNTAYWTARNAGYDRIAKIEHGADDHEVKVTFATPVRRLAVPVHPALPEGRDGHPGRLQRRRPHAAQGHRRARSRSRSVDRKAGDVTLARNPRWWGEPAKLDQLVLAPCPRDERAAALAAGKLDLAEVDPAGRRIALAAREGASSGPRAQARRRSARRPATARLGRRARRRREAGADELGRPREEPSPSRRTPASRRPARLRRPQVPRARLHPARPQRQQRARWPTSGSAAPWPAPSTARRSPTPSSSRSACPPSPLGSHLLLAGQHGYAGPQRRARRPGHRRGPGAARGRRLGAGGTGPPGRGRARRRRPERRGRRGRGGDEGEGGRGRDGRGKKADTTPAGRRANGTVASADARATEKPGRRPGQKRPDCPRGGLRSQRRLRGRAPRCCTRRTRHEQSPSPTSPAPAPPRARRADHRQARRPGRRARRLRGRRGHGRRPARAPTGRHRSPRTASR